MTLYAFDVPGHWSEDAVVNALKRRIPGLVLSLELRPTSKTEPVASQKYVDDCQLDPPAFAEFLLEVFLTSKRGQDIVGDMRERFGRECIELGRKRAVRRYGAHCLRTLWPLACRTIGRAVKWGAFMHVFWHHWHG
jgi:hypothetical protein